jgi:uncharacterized protein YacL
MKKWIWCFTIAVVTWAVGFKFSPEETIWGTAEQLRFEAVSLVVGAFLGLMFGLLATRSENLVQEKRKIVYSMIAFTALAVVLTGGHSLVRVAIGCVSGAAIGFLIGGANYISSRRRFIRPK